MLDQQCIKLQKHGQNEACIPWYHNIKKGMWKNMHESVNCFLLEIFAAVWASHVHVIQIPRRGEDV
jgi:hypothetical protein